MPNQQELFQNVLTAKQRIHLNVSNRLQYERSRLDKLKKSYPLATPERLYRPFTEKLAQMETNLEQAVNKIIWQKTNSWSQLQSRLAQQSPKHLITLHKKQIDYLSNQLTRASIQLVDKHKQNFQSTVRTLEALNPLSIMTKGFTVTFKDDKMVKGVKELQEKDIITVKYKDGEISAEVKDIRLLDEGEI